MLYWGNGLLLPLLLAGVSLVTLCLIGAILRFFFSLFMTELHVVW